MRSKLKSVATGLSAVQMRWQRSNDLVKKRYPVLGRLSSRLQGWRGALLIFAVTAWVLFLANAAISVVLTVRGGGVVSDGTITNPTIMSGSCASVNSADTWIHLAMNVNSAILLAATVCAVLFPCPPDLELFVEWVTDRRLTTELPCWSRTSQCKPGRPSRAPRLTKSMPRARTADVGIPSLRNMTRIRPARFFLWCTMLLAALPLHFVYNSAVYSTASTSSYNVYVVAPDFFEGAFVPAAASSGSSDMPATTEYKSIQNLATFNRSDSEWEAMDMPALVGRYSSGSVDTYRDVVLVAKQTDFNMSGLGVLFHYTAAVSDDSTQNLWLCQFFTRPWSYNCDSGSIGNMSRPAWSIEAPDGSSDLFRPQYWTVDIKNVRVDLQPRGLSEKNTLACRLIANPLFWWLTAACNLVIAACLSGMCCQFQGPTTPLVTVGDVIDSFLTTPSAEISRSGCTYGYGAFKNMFRPALWPRPYVPRRARWWRAAGLRRWSLTTLWLFSVLSVVLVAFVYFARGSDGVSVKDVFRKGGFGSFDRNAAIWGFNTASTVVSPRAKWRLVLLANTPQFVFSMTYLLYNAVLTTMLAEHEWQAFGQHQQPCTLRVSQPRGQQRSTFFLSLPYQYGVPFLAISGAMQWLVSQSLFFAEVDLWTERGERMYGDAGFATLGYSTLAMFWVIVVGFLSWLFVVVLGTVRSFPVGMPLMGACSAVIAASCHVPVELVCGGQNRRDVAAGAVSWGAVKEIGRGDTGGGGGGGGGGDNDDDDGEEEEQWLSFVPGQAEQAVAHQVYG